MLMFDETNNKWIEVPIHKKQKYAKRKLSIGILLLGIIIFTTIVFSTINVQNIYSGGEPDNSIVDTYSKFDDKRDVFNNIKDQLFNYHSKYITNFCLDKMVDDIVKSHLTRSRGHVMLALPLYCEASFNVLNSIMEKE